MNLPSPISIHIRAKETRRLGLCYRAGLSLSAAFGVMLAPGSAWACAACYGQSDSSMAAGMNWGIMSLLGVIVFVLGGVAGFFVFLARRSVKMAASRRELLPPQAASGIPAFKDSAPADLEPVGARGGVGQRSVWARRRAKCVPTPSRARQ